MSKPVDEKYYDVRTMDRYLTKGLIKKSDVETHLKSLPNDEDNFELSVLDDDELGIGEVLSDDEIEKLPPMSEDDIDNFDFLEKEEE
jgi:hypothetical protein